MATQEVALPQYPEVFISHQGGQLRNGFFSDFERALKRNGVNVYHGQGLLPGVPIENLFKVIEESRIALVIFSSRYTESRWCLDELLKIKERVEEGKLVVIPVFYKLMVSEVKLLKGKFGDNFRDLAKVSSLDKIEKWRKALIFVSGTIGFVFDEMSDNEANFINKIVEQVKIEITRISPRSEDLKGVDGTNSDRNPKEVEIVQPDEKSRRDDSFTLIKLPPNHQMLPYGFLSHLLKVLESYSQLGMIIGCLLLLFFCLKHIAYMSTPLRGESGAIDRVVENVPKVLDCIPAEKTEIPRDKFTEFSTNPENLCKEICSNSPMDGKAKPPNILVFISFLGMIIGCLLLLFFCLQHIAYMSKPLTGESGAIDRVVENLPKVLEYIPAEQTEIPRDKFTEFSTNPENFPMNGKVKPPNIQVFINFRGDQLRNNFIGYLVDALRRSEINVFIDNHEQRGEDLNTLFKRIEDSGIAIVVFSSRYTESKWCLDELVKIKERVHQGLLKVLPIFYKVTPDNVKRLKGEFGDNFREQEHKYESDEPKIKRWKEAIVFVTHKHALTLDEKSSVLEIDFVETIVKEVLKILQTISTVESSQSSR